jgi:transposase
MLTDEHWTKLKFILLQLGVYNKQTLRQTVEGILYRLRTGIPWRDLPQYFGRWFTVYGRFREWCAQGLFKSLFSELKSGADTEWHFIDGTILKAHQHAMGASSEHDEAIGKSVGGNTTKIHLAVDSYVLPINLLITGGEVHDAKMAPDLIDMLSATTMVVADKGYDAEQIRMKIINKGAIPVIPRKSNSLIGNDDMDWLMYKYRHLVENAFARLKHLRAIATRYDKLKIQFEGMVFLACSMMRIKL